MSKMKEFLQNLLEKTEQGRSLREAVEEDYDEDEDEDASGVDVGNATPIAVSDGGGDEMMTAAATAQILDPVERNNVRLQLLEQELDVVEASDPEDTIPAPPSFAEDDSLELEADISAPAAPVAETPVQEEQPADFVMPPTHYMHQGRRVELVCEGVCSNCAHCGMTLTDAVSIERGIGPTCSKRGYLEDPVSSDEMQAFIDLAEYPELCTYLTAKYKPLGVRGLMNGLVKIASLNRKSSGLHAAICDAIDSLGYKRLASTLRESIAVIEVKDSTVNPNFFKVWVKKASWNLRWGRELNALIGVHPYGRAPREDKYVLVAKQHKRALWDLMLRHYEGLAAKTSDGTVKITRATVAANKEEAPAS